MPEEDIFKSMEDAFEQEVVASQQASAQTAEATEQSVETENVESVSEGNDKTVETSANEQAPEASAETSNDSASTEEPAVENVKPKRTRRTKAQIAADNAAKAAAEQATEETTSSEAAPKDAPEGVEAPNNDEPEDVKNLSAMEIIYRVGLALKSPKSNLQVDPVTGRTFSYRTVEDIFSALRPFKERYGFFITFCSNPIAVGNYNYTKVVATLHTLSGDEFSVISSAREDDKRDGNWAAQISGSCESYAKKYALQSLFMIDNEVLEPVFDPDAHTCHSTQASESQSLDEARPAPQAPNPVEGKPFLVKGIGVWPTKFADAGRWTGSREAFKAKILSEYRISEDDLELLLTPIGE